jgi:soluble lytic murein transglycosylase-like protein
MTRQRPARPWVAKTDTDAFEGLARDVESSRPPLLQRTIRIALVILLVVALILVTSWAITEAVAPAGAATKAINADGGRTSCSTVAQCRHALAWQRKDRAHLRHQLAVKYSRDAGYAIRLASAAFGVNEQNMRTIARCESNLGAQATAEAGSGASGLFQFLPSTWRRTPFAGFDIFDPLPNALAAAQLVVRDGSWREWSCSSITGVR